MGIGRMVSSIAKKSVVLFAYGEMGPFALEGLVSRFSLLAIVVPPEGERYNTSAAKRTKALASSLGIRMVDGQNLERIHQLIVDCRPDAALICSYDKIIPKKTLQLCQFINVHHGDLPRYRGRANINWAIITGRTSMGISIHDVVPELDAGTIFQMWHIPIGLQDYLVDVYQKVNERILRDLPTLVEQIMAGKVTPVSQQGIPTYCCTRIAEDSRINWNDSATNIRNLIRASGDGYRAFCHLNGKDRLEILSADIEPFPRVYEGKICGRVGRIFKGIGVEILTATDPLIIKDVVYQGRQCLADEPIKSLSDTLR